MTIRNTTNRMHVTCQAAALCLVAAFAAADPPTEPKLHPQQSKQSEIEIINVTPEIERPRTLTEELLDRIDELGAENRRLRLELAEATLDREEAEAELAEMKQFLADNKALGDDFLKYLRIKAEAEQETKAREREIRRAEYEARKAERDAHSAAIRAARKQQNAANQRVRDYERAGFTPIGLDVYTGKMAFFYRTTDTTRETVDYDSAIGNYLRVYPDSEIDFSRMTISGSVMNTSNEVRNLGIAITFFDESGNQVGSETIQINNARPEVPYPFTSEIQMALNRPFTNSSTYVLYADPIAPTE